MPKRTSNAMGFGFLWLLFFCFIGIIQIFIVFGVNWFLVLSKSISLKSFFEDGFFIFFTISLIAGILYEFWFEFDSQINKLIKNGLIALCVIMAIVAMSTYALVYVSKLGKTSQVLGHYIMAQKVLTTFSLILSFTMKSIIYYSK